MRFKRKQTDSEELVRTLRQADGPLTELTALLKTSLPLMQRLEMEDSPAYRAYEDALRTLEQLRRTNESLSARAQAAPVPAETPCPSKPAKAEAAPVSGQESPASQGFSLPDAALSRRVQILFNRSASVESAAERNPAFALFRARRSARDTAPTVRRPAPRAAATVRPSQAPAKPLTGTRRPPVRPSAETTASAVATLFAAPPAASRPKPPVVPAVPPAAPSGPDAAPPVPPMYKIRFSAAVPGPLLRGGCSMVHLFMIEKDCSLAVEDLLHRNPAGFSQTRRGVAVRVTLHSPDLELTGNTQVRDWPGESLPFTFAFSLPEDYLKRQVQFTAAVYINEVIATRLTFLVSCAAQDTQIIAPRRRDVLSAFLSYAGEDRARAEAVLQGMQKARPDLHVFSDVESLRSGANWRETLPLEIARRDAFFLCWSHYAKDSFWVNWEWHCALKVKGVDCIEPIPLESPDRCPPPRDLSGKHFNDHLLQMMDAMQNGT